MSNHYRSDSVNGQDQTDQTRRIKKRRRRKTSKSQTAHDSSEYTDEDEDSCSESNVESRAEVSVIQTSCSVDDNKADQDKEKPTDNLTETVEKVEEHTEEVKNEEETDEVEHDIQEEIEKVEPRTEMKAESENNLDADEEASKDTLENTPPTTTEAQEDTEEVVDERSNAEVHQSPSEVTADSTTDEHSKNPSPEPAHSQKSELKPDAEEFVPRAYRNSEIPINPNLQFIKVPPSFIPIPIMPLGDFSGQNYNPTFIPPGIPINFIPPDPKMYPNFVSFVPNTHFVPRANHANEETQPNSEETAAKDNEDVATCDINTAKDETEHQTEKDTEKTLPQTISTKTIDIATIVSKLEEAAKEQDSKDARTSNHEGEETQNSPRRRFDNKSSRINQKYKNIPNYRRNNYNSAQNSPQRNIHTFKEKTPNLETSKETKHAENEVASENKLEKAADLPNGASGTESRTASQEQPYIKRNPENRKNWKYPPNGSPKWQQNSPIKGYKPTQNGKPITENNVRDYRLNQSSRNYSATLKNKTSTHGIEQKMYEYHASEKQRNNQSDVNSGKNEEAPKTPTRQPKQLDQWISVSSRKKRKNKSTDETEVSFEEKNDHSERDLFEQYDVDQLIDVVPSSQEEEEIIKVVTAEEIVKVETAEEIEIEDIINTITQNEASLINNMENMSLNLTIRSVDEVERELIVKEVPETEILTPEAEIVLNEVEFTEKSTQETITETNEVSAEEVVKTKSNRKSKKGTQKPITKRVMITDIDLSMKCEDVKTPLKKIVTKLNEKSNESVKMPQPVIEEKTNEKVQDDLLKQDDDEEKKKNKKKKKKSNKTTITNSLSSSNTTINNMDDSYDFLLDSALSQESIEKTNDEISRELDKIIQKGMYSSLEGKIKSMNIDDSDGFFKSVFSNISGNKSSVDKNGFNKTLDLTKILQDSRPSSLFRPSSVSQENNSQNKDINKMLPDLDSPVEDGFFLENTNLTDTLQGHTDTTNDKQTEETQNEDMIGRCGTDDDATKHVEIEQKTLYPITEAVKEWMCKTRETTPDVEILKSPHAIYKEFCDSASETDTVVSDLTALGDEEVTIFAKESEMEPEETNIHKQDIMEYWENDLGICEIKPKNEGGSIVTEDACENKLIEEGEEAVEIYDSKYGKNEDYLNLQREIKEKINNPNHMKHGNLPYRAICCSIM